MGPMYIEAPYITKQQTTFPAIGSQVQGLGSRSFLKVSCLVDSSHFSVERAKVSGFMQFGSYFRRGGGDIKFKAFAYW